MEESPHAIINPSIHEAIAATITLENWFRGNQSNFQAWSLCRRREAIRDTRYFLRHVRDNPQEEKQPNEPL